MLLWLRSQYHMGIWGVNLYSLCCRRKGKKSQASLWHVSPFVPWNYGARKRTEALEAGRALLQTFKPDGVDYSFKDPRIDMLQSPLLSVLNCLSSE